MTTENKLKNYVERIENLNHELDGVKGDIKLVYDKAKAEGFDVKTLRKLIQLRKVDASTRAEADQLLETYKSALGMV